MSKSNYFSLIYFINGIFFYGVGYSSIFKLCHQNSWIVILIGSIISFLLVPVYMRIVKHNNKLVKIINNLLILLINMMILRIFTTSFYLTKTPGVFITIPFILLCFYNSKKGKKNILKESNILLIFSISVIVLNLIASTKTGSTTFFKPILNITLNKTIKGVFYYLVFILSPLVLLSDDNVDSKTLYKSFIFINMFLLFIALILIFVLGPKLISMYRFPEYMIFKEINLFGFVENVENLVGLIYFLNLFITSSFCINNISNIVKKDYIVLILIGAILLITELVSDKYNYSMYIYKNLPIILLIFILLHIISYALKKE